MCTEKNLKIITPINICIVLYLSMILLWSYFSKENLYIENRTIVNLISIFMGFSFLNIFYVLIQKKLLNMKF